MSPPISSKVGVFAGRTAYNISKMGMTMVALGVTAEAAGADITGNALWPATIIESLASKNFQMGQRDMWRTANIIADATVGIVCDDAWRGELQRADGLCHEDTGSRHHRRGSGAVWRGTGDDNALR